MNSEYLIARVLRRIFRPKSNEVTGGWRKCIMWSFITSSSIIRMIKSRRMRWAGHVARMGGKQEYI
jgi:hypothetical protein